MLDLILVVTSYHLKVNIMLIVSPFPFKKMLKQAQQRATNMLRQGLYARFQLSEQERTQKALIGCMGELGFETLLQQQGVSYELDQTDFQYRQSDEFDFLINGKKIDIKVAKKSTVATPNDSWTYGYPQEQHPQQKDIIVVGWIDFERSEIGFYGWITGSQVAQFSVVTHNTYRGYRYLTPNHEFEWGALDQDFDQLLWGKLH